jgi:hypothetical protein
MVIGNKSVYSIFIFPSFNIYFFFLDKNLNFVCRPIRRRGARMKRGPAGRRRPALSTTPRTTPSTTPCSRTRRAKLKNSVSVSIEVNATNLFFYFAPILKVG